MHSFYIVILVVVNFHSSTAQNQGKASYIDAGQLHVIDGSVTDQSKQDTSYSLLLAQLAADNKEPRSSIANWYRNYDDVLSNIAWITSSSEGFQPFNPSTDTVSLKSVIQTSLNGRITPDLQDILNRAFDKIEQLGSTNPIINQFTSEVHSNNVYNMQIQLVNENNGNLVVFQLYVTLTTSESIGSDVFLFHQYAKSAASIQVAYHTIELNKSVYARIRQSIIDKLGSERIAKYIQVLFDDVSML